MGYVSDPITNKLNQFVCSRELYFDLLGFEDLNLSEQALLGTWELANELYNGGFMQYFHNGSGAHAISMIAVFRSINSPGAATIVEEAMKLAGPGTPWGNEPNFLQALKMIPAAVKDRMIELERAFFDQSDEMHLAVFRYLSAHRDQIDAPDDFWSEATIQ